MLCHHPFNCDNDPDPAWTNLIQVFQIILVWAYRRCPIGCMMHQALSLLLTLVTPSTEPQA